MGGHKEKGARRRMRCGRHSVPRPKRGTVSLQPAQDKERGARQCDTKWGGADHAEAGGKGHNRPAEAHGGQSEQGRKGRARTSTWKTMNDR